MEIATLIKEYLAVLAWPSAVIVGLLLFRTRLVELLTSRGFKIGAAGIEISPPSASDQPSVKFDDRLQVPLPKPMHLPPALQEYAEKIEEMVRKSSEDGARRANLSLEHYLVRIAADSAGALFLERAYWPMFGSQLKALQHLVNRSGKVARTDIEAFFKEAVTKYPDFYKNTSFETWLLYLIHAELIKSEVDQIHLLPAGQALLAYIQNRNYSTERYG